jgi:hypothetical protein
MNRAVIANLNDGCSILQRCREVSGWSQELIAAQFRVPVGMVQD